MEEGWMKKRVYIETNSGRRYAGVVVEEDEVWIHIIDIKGLRVSIRKKEIEIIQEERK